jgi:hypothetical protein
MKKLIVLVTMLLPVFSAYSQTQLSWTFGSSAMGTSAEVDAGSFQIQVLGDKYSGEADVSLTTSVSGLDFNVNADQWYPTGVITNITQYDGAAVTGLVLPMTGPNTFSLQADTYKFFGTDFYIYFVVTVDGTTYVTDQLHYVYTTSGSLVTGIKDIQAPSKKCNISVNDNKVSIDLGSAKTNESVAHVTDILGRAIYNGPVADGIDISGYSKGLYVISVSNKKGVYCSAKFARP